MADFLIQFTRETGTPDLKYLLNIKSNELDISCISREKLKGCKKCINLYYGTECYRETCTNTECLEKCQKSKECLCLVIKLLKFGKNMVFVNIVLDLVKSGN